MTDRLYYADSTLTEFHSRIADIRLVSRIDSNALWQVALESSAFYPTSGGQPFDTGILRASSRSGAVIEVPVIAVEEDEQGEVWHSVEKPLSAGTEVEGVIDWRRRLDHMQQHSGQHLLSAVFATELSALTLSFHLGEQGSTIDLEVNPHDLIDLAQVNKRLEIIEQRANELIFENRSVSIRTVEQEEAAALLASGRLRKLPERDGPIRLIQIAGYDLNACGGTHVQSTGQIGGLLLRSAEKVRHGLRVEFVCGLRAAAMARREYELLSKASAALSTGSEKLPEAVDRLLAENKSAAKERHKLRTQLADLQAVQFVATIPSGDGNKLRVVRQTFDPETDADYCKLLASRIVATAPNTLVLFAARQAYAAMVIVAAGKGQAFSCGDLLRAELAKLGLRGGGSREMAQGQLPPEGVTALLDALQAAARQHAPAQQPITAS